jgi:hypothetical protein
VLGIPSLKRRRAHLVWKWELTTGRALSTLEGHASHVTACAVTPDSRHMVSASSDKMLKVWELATGRALATLEGHTGHVTACVLTPDSRHVVSASSDQTVKVWELATGRALATLEGHTDEVTACAVTPDGRHVVSASSDQTLKVWELAAGRALATLKGHTDEVTACAVTPDGRHVVSASRDKTLKVWELAPGRALATLEGHTGYVTACTITPDGRHVVSASWDQTLKVWALATGSALGTFKGHTGVVVAYAVTLDGRHLVSASWDQTLKVWDLETHACLATHRGDVAYLTVAATTAVIVAGDSGGGVWFLDVPPSFRSVGPSSVRQGVPRESASHLEQVPIPRRLRMNKHTILFLAANPLGTDRLALDREARAIQVELERSGHRDRFELVTRWAAEPLDLLRELRRLKPTVVHFSGHGGQIAQAGARPDGSSYRDVVVDDDRDREDEQGGLFFQGSDGRPQRVSTKALQETFGAAGASVQVVVLNACYSSAQAQALLAHVDCVVGMRSAIRDDVARSFAIGFYGGLGERESIAAAHRQGCAAISLEGLPATARPQLAVRHGIDAEQLVLAMSVNAGPVRVDLEGRRHPSQQTRETLMTRDDLLTRLSQLLPSQFEEVLFRARIPTAHLSGASAPQAIRAIDAIRYLEQQNQLEQLAWILKAVSAGTS